MAENTPPSNQQPPWLQQEIEQDKQRQLEEEMKLPPESGNPEWLKKMAAEVDSKQLAKKPDSPPATPPK